MSEFRIVRRAFSEYTEVTTVTGWVAAEIEAMRLQAERQDGEYLVRAEGEAYQSTQSGVTYSL